MNILKHLRNKILNGFRRTPSEMEKKFEIDTDNRLSGFSGVAISIGIVFGIYLMSRVIPFPSFPSPLISDPRGPKVVVEFVTPPKRIKIKPSPRSAGGDGGGEKRGPNRQGGKPRGPSPKEIMEQVLNGGGGAVSQSMMEKIHSVTELASNVVGGITGLSNNTGRPNSVRKERTSYSYKPGQKPGLGKGIDIEGLRFKPTRDIGNRDELAVPDGVAVKPTEISFGPSGNGRSAASIQRTIRSRINGLRHIFNRFLGKFPGMAGKVFIKFEISPTGKVVKVSVLKSTTGVDSFDKMIKKRVRRWRFESIDGTGLDVVTVPFNFSE